MARTMAIASGLAFTLAAITVHPAGGGEPSDLTSGGQAVPESSAVSEEDVTERPTAEEVLAELQKRRPLNELIPPASAASREATGGDRKTLPEGSSLIDRRGRLEYRSPWWMFLDESKSQEPALKLLSNAILETMVRTTIGTAASVSFVVSGELTVFRGENYFLPRVAMRATEPAESRESVESGTALPPDASAEQVFDRLMGEKPTQEILLPLAQVSGGLRAGSPSAGHPAFPDGSLLVNRPGRIARDGPWWNFVFESDHPDHPELPMKLLPNMNVDLMATAAERDSGGLIFVVSGEVTAFGGENFLLPRVAMHRVDLGNLRK